MERVFCQPRRDLSITLSQYKSEETEQIFVQYRRDSAVVERVESTYSVALGTFILVSLAHSGHRTSANPRTFRPTKSVALDDVPFPFL